MTIPVDSMIQYMLVFLRALALFLSMPFLSWKMIPVQVRIALAAALAIAVTPALPALAVPANLPNLVLAVVHSVLCGLLLGFAMRLIVATVELAGQFIAVNMGLAMAVIADPRDQTQSTTVTQWLTTLAMIVFFMSGFHHLSLHAFLRSYQFQPNGQLVFVFDDFEWIASAGSYLFEIALAMSAPIIAVNFLINLSFAVLGKVTPRMNVFVTSFPVRLLAGFAILAGSTGLLTEFIINILQRSVDTALVSVQ